MRIFITGADGFIGSNLCFYLEKLGHEIVPLCSNTNFVSDHFKNTIYRGIFGFPQEKLSDCDGIIHMAAQNDTTTKNEPETIRLNYEESVKLHQLGQKYNHKFFVYASTAAVYGSVSERIKESHPAKPLNIYAKSKLMFDEYVKDNSLNCIGLRFCNVYGPNEDQKSRRKSYIKQMIDDISKNKNVKLFTDGTQKRDWVYVLDVCQAVEKSIKSKNYGIYNIGSGTSISFIELFNFIKSIFKDSSSEIEWVDNPIKDQYQNFTELDVSFAKEKINYEPEYDIYKGIIKYIESNP